ncbi:MAG: cupredoxin domain-containing protein [Patescibacteria group bacterium]|nr:cupredoxin domain-containing protein [Patescibacteria group bacterium]
MLRRLVTLASTVAMLAGMVMPVATQAAVTSVFNPGSLIKGSGQAVYYFAENGKRYVFPNEKTYFTWYANFDTVVQIPDNLLYAIPIGGNVTYRPGKKMVKITTDPKVYVVDRGAYLRHVTTEQLAQTFYNINWKNQIDDVPDAFFTNYKMGNAITTATEYKPTDVMTMTTTISQDKGFDDTMAAVSIGNTLTGFVPATMTVKVGTTVTWTNQDSASHSINSDGFQSPDLPYNKTYTHKFSQAGSFQYYDGLNRTIVGTINVK